jgi:microcystin-dependent protein
MSRAALRERLYSNLKRKNAVAEPLPFMGQILLVPYNFAPRGWAFCQGQLLQIAQYGALFTLISNTFGGDGDKTFALPDLRGQVPQSSGQLNYIIALQGYYPDR